MVDLQYNVVYGCSSCVQSTILRKRIARSYVALRTTYPAPTLLLYQYLPRMQRRSLSSLVQLAEFSRLNLECMQSNVTENLCKLAVRNE